MKEYFDVLTENGEYTDRIETRDECHSKGLWHKAVAVFIINSKNQVLLQKRSANKKSHPNCWDISGAGHIKAGESVKKGSIIGKVGPKYLKNGKLNGATTGVHLHLGVLKNGEFIDPLKLF